MKLQNVKRLLLFREDANGHVFGIEELKKRYKIDPAGTNFYFGIDKGTAEDASGGALWALNPTHRAFFDDLLTSLKSSVSDEYTLTVGLEPKEEKDPFGFVLSNLDLVEHLAKDLNKMQQRARSVNRRLGIIVRYASEMNVVDPKNPYGSTNPAGFKKTFIPVREAFKRQAPDVLFSFSPALRADVNGAQIGRFWPGDEHVDVIGGTWYIGAASQRSAAVKLMQDYFINLSVKSKPFGLSEIGGAKGTTGGNDAVLESMLHDLEALEMRHISFKYATIFLSEKWGKDAKLSFLQ